MKYVVTCDYTITEVGTKKIIVEAANEEDAEKIAIVKFKGECLDDYEIISVEREGV